MLKGNSKILEKKGKKSPYTCKPNIQFFLGKVFWDFQKWTKKMSKIQNPKKVCPKNHGLRP